MEYIALNRIDFGDKIVMPGKPVKEVNDQLIDGESVVPSEVFNRILTTAENLIDSGMLADAAFASAKEQVLPGYRFQMVADREAKRLEAGVPSENNNTQFIPEALSKRAAKTDKPGSKQELKKLAREKMAAQTNTEDEPNDPEALAKMKGPGTKQPTTPPADDPTLAEDRSRVGTPPAKA